MRPRRPRLSRLALGLPACGATASLLAALFLAAGCGGEREDAAPATAPAAPTVSPAAATAAAAPLLSPRLVAALGDSITAGSPLWDPVPAVREQFAAQFGRRPDPQSEWEYWYERAHPGVQIRNCGVFGQTVAQIEAREATCVAGAKDVVVQGGINDIAQGLGIDGAAQHLTAIVRTLKGEGHGVVLVEVLPWNNGYPQAAPLISALNERIRALGKAEGVRVLPWYSALEDPSAPGRMRRALTFDGDHPSVAGYRRLAGTVVLP